MMTDRFTIKGDPSRSLLHITLRGHWDVEVVREYKRALLTVVDDMRAKGCKPGAFLALVDIRQGSAAQSQDVVAVYKNELARGELAPRKLATLVTGALFRRQVERIAMPNQRLFTEESDAMAWLLSPEDGD